jgi:hypothetical protein
VVNGQAVVGHVAGGDRDDDGPGEALLGEQVEDGLGERGVGGAVDRGGDDEHVGRGHLVSGGVDAGIGADGQEGSGVEVGQVDDGVAAGQLERHLGDRARAGRVGRAAVDGHHAQGRLLGRR